jgi:hypothetical protein
MELGSLNEPMNPYLRIKTRLDCLPDSKPLVFCPKSFVKMTPGIGRILATGLVENP